MSIDRNINMKQLNSVANKILLGKIEERCMLRYDARKLIPYFAQVIIILIIIFISFF